MSTRPIKGNVGPLAALERLRGRDRIVGHFDVEIEAGWSDRLAEAQAMVTAATNRDDIEAIASAGKVLADLEADRDSAVLRFEFRRLSPAEFQRLVDQHPPTEAQVASGRAQGGWGNVPQWNRDTFPAGLLAASVVDCGVEDWTEALALLSPGEAMLILQAAVGAQTNVPRLGS